MPITVKEIIEKVGLNPALIRKTKWGEQVNSTKSGIYIVSLSENPSENNTLYNCPISMPALKAWINKMNGFKLDGVMTKDAGIISKRIAKFWIKDENILYIGKTNDKKGLKSRVNRFYKHIAGDRTPHAGGHWLKILNNLEQLYVYYIECKDSKRIESLMLDNIFSKALSEESKQQLVGTEPMLPFGNLEDGRKIRKKHGLCHMKKK